MLPFLASVALGLFVGFVNGFIVVRLKVSSFIATLGVSSILTALAVIVTESIVPPASVVASVDENDTV